MGIALLWSQLNKPSIGTVHNKTTSQAAPRAASWTKLTGKQFSMEYYDDYVAKQADLHAGLDQYFFIEDGLITKHLAVAVAKLNGHGLTEEPAYQMRSLTPQTYKLDTRAINSQAVPVMERLDNTEQVAFIVRGDLLGTIALTTGNPADPPKDELNHMISSWAWQ